MYNFDVLLERRHTDSTKWDAMERDYGRDDLMPFWVADADFPVLPEISIHTTASVVTFGKSLFPMEVLFQSTPLHQW